MNSNFLEKLTWSLNRIINNTMCSLREKSYFLRYKFAKSTDLEFKHLVGKNKCIVCLAADYGNLGDVAITYAQTKFLSQKFPDYEIVDFPISKTLTHLRSLKKVCTEDDIITLTGGGYMGDMYFRSELFRQLIFKVFRKNRIISFPQTADFSNTPLGQQMQKRAVQVYSKCHHMELWAREEQSYHFMKDHFPQNNVRLTPDIVMTLNEFKNHENRKGVTYCLRNDKEKNPATDTIINIITEVITSNREEIQNYDTHIGDVRLDIPQRATELNKIWEQFQKSRLVITDRLHGMIFAYITGTPAIVLQNRNFKVAECYKWICDCGYIHLIDDSDNLAEFITNQYNNTETGFTVTHSKILEIFNNIKFSNL